MILDMEIIAKILFTWFFFNAFSVVILSTVCMVSRKDNRTLVFMWIFQFCIWAVLVFIFTVMNIWS